MLEMQEKKWLLVEFNDTTSREHVSDIASEAIQKELDKARRHVAELESKLAKANAKIAQTELQFSQLSEMREVMIEVGFTQQLHALNAVLILSAPKSYC